MHRRHLLNNVYLHEFICCVFFAVFSEADITSGACIRDDRKMAAESELRCVRSITRYDDVSPSKMKFPIIKRRDTRVTVSSNSVFAGDAFVRSADKPAMFLSVCCFAILFGCVHSQSPPNAPEEQSGLNRGRAPLMREMGKE